MSDISESASWVDLLIGTLGGPHAEGRGLLTGVETVGGLDAVEGFHLSFVWMGERTVGSNLLKCRIAGHDGYVDAWDWT